MLNNSNSGGNLRAVTIIVACKDRHIYEPFSVQID